MSTNYDWTLPGKQNDPHIGKISSVKGPLGLVRRFIWAADPVQTVYLLMTLSNERCAIDEYGKQYTGRGMLTRILGCAEADYSSIREEFS